MKNNYNTIDPLTRERERELIERAQAGDERATDTLIRANMRFAIQYCNELAGPNAEEEDLYQEAAAGLLRAIRTHDNSKQIKLISHALWWIRSYVYTHLKTKINTVRLPDSQQRRHREVRQRQEQMSQLQQQPVSITETLEDLEYNAADTELYALWSETRLESLDRPASYLTDRERKGIDRLMSILEMQADDTAPDPLLEVLRTEDRERLLRALDRLPDRLRYIITRLYGLHPNHYGETPTLQAVADEIGMTRERVRQLRNVALGKMKKSCRTTTIA